MGFNKAYRMFCKCLKLKKKKQVKNWVFFVKKKLIDQISMTLRSAETRLGDDTLSALLFSKSYVHLLKKSQLERSWKGHMHELFLSIFFVYLFIYFNFIL
jgi:hypothetical protein